MIKNEYWVFRATFLYGQMGIVIWKKRAFGQFILKIDFIETKMKFKNLINPALCSMFNFFRPFPFFAVKVKNYENFISN